MHTHINVNAVHLPWLRHLEIPVRLIYAFFILLAMSAGAHAEVYVCDDGGHKTFSQEPCGTDAKVVTVEGSDGTVTVGPNATPETLAATCKLMRRGISIASGLAQENININTAQQRVFGFIRDHITNFRDVVRQNPAYYTFINQNATLVTAVGYRTAGQGVTDDDINDFIAQCTRSAIDKWQETGKLPDATHKTGDKMM